MPTQAPRPCSHPGCRVLVTDGARCDAHRRQAASRLYDQTTRRNDPTLAAAKRFRDSTQWQRFRAYFRAQHPLCCDPFGTHAGMPPLMDAIHHVLPLAQRPDLGLTPANCRPLCHRCHNRIEGMERRGEATQALFSAPTSGGDSKV